MVSSTSDLLVTATIGFAVLSLAIMLWYLYRRPALDTTVKILLLLGIFALPLTSAMTGNIAGYEATQTREFCSGCHVMLPYTDDSAKEVSKTLASMHARSEVFGDRNCYQCHKDYEMFGAVTTKLVGLKHAYMYATKYINMPQEQALGSFRLYSPFKNQTCMHCHSTKLAGFEELEDHRGALEDIRKGTESCVSSGCHGPAHPFSKPDSEKAVAP